MKTVVYMVRHGESPKNDRNERTRGLTAQGIIDAHQVTLLLKNEAIDVFVSSPYERAVLTIKELAHSLGRKIIRFEDLKERMFTSGNQTLSNEELAALLKRSFHDPKYALHGGESNEVCQRRAVRVLLDLINTYQGKKIAIGTHGAVMTLMMGYFDHSYNLNFLLQTSKPDVYRLDFDGLKLINVRRLWPNG
ncbi:MAG: histidine phosphatase family protein [Sporolactobacillus sp.]|uniref:histidine phosphatase family protein n=1 Tax=Sporolactobacillus sp. STSJ-5 TaxID=2965076 RepID=UPI002104A995|nr:histidine phosphatase family protein [Sporolactobacillus sp. STSJ-5]MCQ2009841.1 histidine phosphatase family protein [Sporolactobacillus sp. STSJ-5]